VHACSSLLRSSCLRPSWCLLLFCVPPAGQPQAKLKRLQQPVALDRDALLCIPFPQVQTKLKLVGIEAVYLASSGERVTRLDQLQDIDELYVVEVRSIFMFLPCWVGSLTCGCRTSTSCTWWR